MESSLKKSFFFSSWIGCNLHFVIPRHFGIIVPPIWATWLSHAQRRGEQVGNIAKKELNKAGSHCACKSHQRQARKDESLSLRSLNQTRHRVIKVVRPVVCVDITHFSLSFLVRYNSHGVSSQGRSMEEQSRESVSSLYLDGQTFISLVRVPYF